MPPARSQPVSPLDDDDYPAYTMGRAAEVLGTTLPSSVPSVNTA
jgi:hypothetical protein